ncbi:MAG: translation initiation factor IF-5A [Candidatus Aenigmarchaeota archaeon]|nr:translation initiation factor IF-5A [Candidatus Aenigmarchaeota archaeon]
MGETTATIKTLKPGNFVIIDGEPCKVVGLTKSKPGKHGSSKIRLEAMGIFDNRRRFMLKPSSADVQVPIIEKKTAQVISISGDIVQLMDLTDYSTFEANIPEEFEGKLESGREILYWKLGNKILIRELR